MADIFVTPFDLATDGTFTRPSSAWAEDPNVTNDIVIQTFVSNERRVFEIDSENWLFIEGARENLVTNNLAMWASPWAGGSQDEDTPAPTGGDSASATTNSIIAAGFADGVAWNGVQSVYGQSQNAIDLFQLAVTNPSNTTPVLILEDDVWNRYQVIQQGNIGVNIFIVGTAESVGITNYFGATLEREPTNTYPVRFASQPILTLLGAGTRQRDTLIFTNAINAGTSAKTTGFRLSFRPVFESFPTVSGDRFVLFSIAVGTTTVYRLVIEGFGAFERIRSEVVGGSQTNSNACTWDAGQELTVEILTNGTLSLSGFTTGNGSFTGPAFTVPQGDIHYGGEPGTVNRSRIEAFSLMGPLEFQVTEQELVSAVPQSRTTVRVTYDAAVKQTDSSDSDDALNPSNYEVLVGAMPMAVTSVTTVTDSVVDLVFSTPILGSQTVTVGAENVASVAFPITTVTDDTVEFTSLANPSLVSGTQLTGTTVEVVFSEAMKQTDANDSDDALNPANYILTGIPSPASVVSVSPTAVSLVFADPLPQNTLVTLGAQNIVAIIDGAVIDAATIQFTTSDRPELSTIGQPTEFAFDVSFSEAVKQEAASDPDDALNATNYTLTGVGFPTNPDSVSMGANLAQVVLNFVARLPENAMLTLGAANIVSDISGLVVTEDTLQFTTLVFIDIVAADQPSRNTVVVTFSEPVQQADPEATTDALNPDNYTITAGVEIPDLVDISPQVNQAEVQLNFDADFPPGIVVTIAVINIQNPAGDRTVTTETFEFTTVVGVELVAVEQTSLNTIRCTFSEPVRQLNPSAVDDGLNPDNYLITSFRGPIPLVQDIDTGSSDSETLVSMDQPLPVGDTIFVATQDIEPASGENLPTDPSQQFSFIAFGAARAPVDAPITLSGRFDLANPQTGRDAGNSPLGTFQITEVGDIRNDTGREYLRKRVFRRLSTTPGGFFHLPTYGLRPQDKELITPTTLRQLQLDVESQIAQEPDVIAARATLSELAPGVISVRVRVEDNLGPFEIEGRINLNESAN